MALFKFTRGIIEGEAIDVYNHGRMERDFTYIDDLVEAIVRLMERPPPAPAARGPETTAPQLLSPVAPYRTINIGAGRPVGLLELIEEIERVLGRKSVRNYMELQPGDPVRTHASADALLELIGWRPSTPVSVGVPAFVAWYKSYDAKG
jgi:UDP-glucuronate 4-epimerase